MPYSAPCYNCGAYVPLGDEDCWRCQAGLQVGCATCRKPVSIDAGMCFHCGTLTNRVVLISKAKAKT